MLYHIVVACMCQMKISHIPTYGNLFVFLITHDLGSVPFQIRFLAKIRSGYMFRSGHMLRGGCRFRSGYRFRSGCVSIICQWLPIWLCTYRLARIPSIICERLLLCCCWYCCCQYNGWIDSLYQDILKQAQRPKSPASLYLKSYIRDHDMDV